MVFPIDYQLSEHHAMLSVKSTVCDPIFLCQRGWGIYDKLLGLAIVSCRCLHLNSIVAITQLG